MSEAPFDETIVLVEEGVEINAPIDLNKDPDDPRLDKINPFAERDGKTLSWIGVNMTVVRIVILKRETFYKDCMYCILQYFSNRTRTTRSTNITFSCAAISSRNAVMRRRY